MLQWILKLSQPEMAHGMCSFSLLQGHLPSHIILTFSLSSVHYSQQSLELIVINSAGMQVFTYRSLTKLVSRCRYDVSAFIDKRNLDTDLPEVKVRFAGFGSEEDEWVNITNAVRQRSLPCETTECVAVLPGDLILCFQVRALNLINYVHNSISQ
jgi:hypothetical protein